MKHLVLALQLLCLFSVAVSSAANASTFTVTTTNDSGPGSLRAEIEDANAHSGSTVAFQPGLSGTITLRNTLPTILTGMTIAGPGASTLTVSGASLYRCAAISSGAGTVAVTGLTFANGNDSKGDSGGGALFVASGTVDVTNCVFSSCSSTTGGGAILADYGTVNITGSQFNNCSCSTDGGAILNYTTLTVASSIFNGDGATVSGSGIYNYGDVSVTASQFENGTNDPISNLNSATIDSSTFNNNQSSSYGGAIHNYYGGNLTLTRSTLYQNESKAQGSAIYNDGTLALTSCTSSGNQGSLSSAVIDIYNDSSGTGSINNSVFQDGEYLPYSVVASALTIRNSNFHDIPVGYPGTANVAGTPLLSVLGNYGGPVPTVALLPGSYSLGTGVATGFTTDQRGVAIPTSGPYDIGAFQSQGFIVTNKGGSGQSAPLYTQFLEPLKFTVAAVSPLEPVDYGYIVMRGPTGVGAASAQFVNELVYLGNYTETLGSSAIAVGNTGTYTALADTFAGSATYTLTNANPPLPVISSFTPTTAGTGVIIGIAGTYIDDATSVSIDGSHATFFLANNGSLMATVPAGISSGPIVVVTPGGTATSSTNLIIDNTPSVLDLDPARGWVTDTLHVSGYNLSNASNVTIGGVSATIISSDPYNLYLTVPTGAVTGPVVITTSYGTATGLQPYTVLTTPATTQLSPNSGVVGTVVNIYGGGFTGWTSATLGGIPLLDVSLINDNDLEVTIPSTASTGKIAITTPFGTATSPTDFVVEP
jgi:hypothetical protein